MQVELNGLMADLLNFQKSIADSSRVIESAIHLKKHRNVIDGKEILSRLPPECIEKYQNVHSVSSVGMQPIFHLLLVFLVGNSILLWALDCLGNKARAAV